METVKSANKNSGQIAIIGAGHMGQALAEGFINAGWNPADIIVANLSGEKLKLIGKKLHVKTTLSNIKAVEFARYIILTVKPSTISEVIKEISPSLSGKILISAAAIVPLKSLKSQIGNREVPVFRIMPNLPVACNKGIIGIFSEIEKSSHILNDVYEIFTLLGLLIPVSTESDIDSLTILAGCGPGIIAYFMTNLEKTGKSILNDVDQQKLIEFLFSGTLELMKIKKISPSLLAKQVATPGGVTEAILSSLDENGLPRLILKAINAGREKIDIRKPKAVYEASASRKVRKLSP